MPHARRKPIVLVCTATTAVVAAVVIGCAGNVPRQVAAIERTNVAPSSPVADVSTGGSSDDWVAFHGDANELIAVFPADVQPQHVDDAVDTPIGSQKIVRFIGSDRDQSLDAGYLIRSSNPLALLAGEKRILDSACEGTARHVGGTVKRSNAMTVDGHAARDIEIAMPADDAHPEGGRAVARLIITDDRIYHAIVCNVDDDESSRRAQAFLNGLRPAGS